MNTCQTWFSRWKSSLATDCRALYGKIWKSFIVIQLLRPTTMPLKRALLIYGNHGPRRVSIGDIYLSWIRTLLQGLCYTIWPGDQLTGPENTEYTVQGSLSSATLHWSMRKSARSCRVEDWWPREYRPSPCDLGLTMAFPSLTSGYCSSKIMEAEIIHMIDWMRKWWWWQQHLA